MPLGKNPFAVQLNNNNNDNNNNNGKYSTLYRELAHR
jgi:hypothetical protein